MTAGFMDDEAHVDPIYQRLMVLDEIEDTLQRSIGQAAFNFTESTEHETVSVTVLNGMVEPMDDPEDGTRYYENQNLSLLALYFLQTGRRLAQIRLNGVWLPIMNYDLANRPTDNENLSQTNATFDYALRHMLGRTAFNKLKSERTLATLHMNPLQVARLERWNRGNSGS